MKEFAPKFLQFTPTKMGDEYENGRMASPENVLIHLMPTNTLPKYCKTFIFRGDLILVILAVLKKIMKI